MKGKIANTDPIFLDYCAPECNPSIGYKDNVFEAICRLNDTTKGPVTATMVRTLTGLGKPAVQKHLHKLVEQGLVIQRFGKFKNNNRVTICGCYELTDAGKSNCNELGN